jgi:hypothetical protein
MATRSLISKANEDGTIQAIYCHHDGYPEHVGKLLVVNYNQLNLDKLFAEPKVWIVRARNRMYYRIRATLHNTPLDLFLS